MRQNAMADGNRVKAVQSIAVRLLARGGGADSLKAALSNTPSYICYPL